MAVGGVRVGVGVVAEFALPPGVVSSDALPRRVGVRRRRTGLRDGVVSSPSGVSLISGVSGVAEASDASGESEFSELGVSAEAPLLLDPERTGRRRLVEVRRVGLSVSLSSASEALGLIELRRVAGFFSVSSSSFFLAEVRLLVVQRPVKKLFFNSVGTSATRFASGERLDSKATTSMCLPRSLATCIAG